MDTKSRYWTRNPNHPIPEDGTAAEYLGIPYDPEFESWYESDFKGRGWVLPYMKYEGPSNPLNKGAPVSYGDYLSKVHDLRYAHASYQLAKGKITKEQFHEKITYADEDFKKLQSNYTAPGLLGQAGIGIKNFIEAAYAALGGADHIYPGNNPTEEDFRTGDEDDTEIDVVPLDEDVDMEEPPPNREEEFTKKYNWSKQHYSLLEQYWMSHDDNKAILKNWSEDAYNAFKAWDEKYGTSSVVNQNVFRANNNELNANVFGVSKQGIPKSSAQWQHGVHTAAGTKYRTNPEAKAKYIREQHEKLYQSIGDEYWNHFKPGAKQFNLHQVRDEIEPNRRERQETTNQEEDQQQNQEEVQQENQETVQEEVNQGASTSNQEEMPKRTATDTPDVADGTSATITGGTGIAPAASQIYIAKGLRQAGNRIRYHNIFRMRSWGTSLFNRPGATTATAIAPSTSVQPYVALPVEFLAFYIPEGLFNGLRTLPQCRPTSVGVKVTPIGQMVNFNTNTGTSQSGTTAHTLYGSGVIGLAQKIPIDKCTITRNPQRPMEISTVGDFTSMAIWIQRIWGQSLPAGNAAIPQATIDNIARAGVSGQFINPNTYMRIYFPTAPRNAAGQISSDASTAASYYPLNQYIPVQPIQPHTGVPIAQMIYPQGPVNWKWPCLGNTAPRMWTAGPANQSIISTRTGKRRRNALTASAAPNGSATFLINGTDETGSADYMMFNNTASYATYRLNNVPPFNSMACEEPFIGPNVPSVHVGIEAVQSNVPEAAVIDYINASCDFLVETEIEFEFNVEHDFPHEGFNLLMDSFRGDREMGQITTDNNINNVHRRGMYLNA